MERSRIKVKVLAKKGGRVEIRIGYKRLWAFPRHNQRFDQKNWRKTRQKRYGTEQKKEQKIEMERTRLEMERKKK